MCELLNLCFNLVPSFVFFHIFVRVYLYFISPDYPLNFQTQLSSIIVLIYFFNGMSGAFTHEILRHGKVTNNERGIERRRKLS